MNEIFISYSRQDSDFVDNLKAELEKRSLKVWIDREDIRGGAAWRSAISNAIRTSKLFVIVLSKQSTLSNNVTKELALADKHKKIIIPIWYQACEIPPEMEYQLAGLQIIDFDSQPHSSALAQLMSAISDTDISIEPARQKKPSGAPRTVKDKNQTARKKKSKLWAVLGIVIFLAFGACLSSVILKGYFSSRVDLSGNYDIYGKSMDCYDLTGQAVITRSGNGYAVEANAQMIGIMQGAGNLQGYNFDIYWYALGTSERYILQSDGSLLFLGVQGVSPCQPWVNWVPR